MCISLQASLLIKKLLEVGLPSISMKLLHQVLTTISQHIASLYVIISKQSKCISRLLVIQHCSYIYFYIILFTVYSVLGKFKSN